MRQCKLKPAYIHASDLLRDLDEAERKAHRNLAHYKFMNFGYWAAIWVHINRVGNFKRPNPFTAYVDLAIMKGGMSDSQRDTDQQAAPVSQPKER